MSCGIIPGLFNLIARRARRLSHSGGLGIRGVATHNAPRLFNLLAHLGVKPLLNAEVVAVVIVVVAKVVVVVAAFRLPPAGRLRRTLLGRGRGGGLLLEVDRALGQSLRRALCRGCPRNLVRGHRDFAAEA